MNEQYPVQFSVEYPDRPLDRLTTRRSVSSSSDEQ